MKRVLLFHVWADGNMGDLAITSSCTKVLKEKHPEVEVLGMSAFAKHDIRFTENHKDALNEGIEKMVPAIFPLPIRKSNENKFHFIYRVIKQLIVIFFLLLLILIFRKNAVYFLKGEIKESFEAILNSDLFAINGGGFIYGFNDLKGKFLLIHVLYGPLIAIILGKKVISFPHSFGPFEGKFNRFIAKRILIKADTLLPRESKSVQTLKNIGVEKNISLVTDIAFLMDSLTSEKVIEMASNLGMNNEENLRVGITARPWHFPEVSGGNKQKIYDNYIETMVSTINYIYKKYNAKVFLITQVSFEKEDDRIALREIQRRTIEGSTILIDSIMSPKELKSLYSYLDILIGTRMHSVIFASDEGVPCIALSYHGTKALGIMTDLGLQEFTLDINDINEEKLKSLVDKLIKERSTIKQKMMKNIQKVKNDLNQTLNKSL